MNKFVLKYCLMISLGLSLSNYIHSQILLGWAASMGGTSSSSGQVVKVDQNGNVYTAGVFLSSCDFNPQAGTNNLVSAGSNDCFISKLNSSGIYQWALKFGGTGYDWMKDMVIDDAGNVYVTGVYNGGFDADPGAGTTYLSSAGGGDAYIIKYGPTGNFIWARTLGSASSEGGEGMTIDHSGDLVITGRFNGTIDFDQGPGVFNMTSDNTDMFVLKLTTSGNFVWAKQCEGAGYEGGYSIASDENDNLYIGGVYDYATDFDPGAGVYSQPAYGGNDMFIMKLTGDGDFVWAHGYGGTSSEQINAVTTDPAGNVYVAGVFADLVDFDPGPAVVNCASNGYDDTFISKFGPTGNFVWIKRIGGTSNEEPLSISRDFDGNIYTTGYFQGTVDFDPGAGTVNLIASANYRDMFVSKLSSGGNYMWASRIGNGTDDDGGESVFVDDNGSIYLTGFYSNTVDLDPTAGVSNSTSAGNDDIFTIKLNQCYNAPLVLNPVVCNSYISPSGMHTWTTSGTYYDSIPNPAGCDSSYQSVTINLTVNHNDPVTHIYAMDCESYTFNSNTYTNSGNYNFTFSNVYGCDSLVTLHLTIGDNSLTLSPNACNSYTLNFQTYTTSGNYVQMLTNHLGCDSIIYLNLIVDGNVTVNQTGNTLTSSLGDTYQWINCSTGNSIIVGANSQSYTPTSSGSYAVIVNQNSCIDTSDCSAFIAIGIEENSLADISIYPNPTDGDVQINLGDVLEPFTIELINTLGQVVSVKNIYQTGIVSFEMPNMAGVYLISITSNGKSIKRKLIKNIK